MITYAIVFDHHGRSKPGKEGPLEVRVIYDRKPYYINTGIKVEGKNFREGRIVDVKYANILQERLEGVVSRIIAAVERCIASKTPINVAEIRRQAYNIHRSDEEKGTAMFDWMKEQIPLLNISAGTRKRYDVLMHRMKTYGKLMSWSDLSVENLYKFDAWLHQIPKPQSNGDIQAGSEQKLIGDAAVYNYHRTLRSLLSRAVKFGIIQSNPYERVRGEFRRGVRDSVEYLTEEEIKAIESMHPIPGTQMAMARDLFIFQLYTGLSYADTQRFSIEDYKKVGNVWTNRGERVKTGVSYVSDLMPQAVEVLERYGMNVPKVNNIQYNLALKVIQQALGIRTRLHSHLARHTFATRALSLGVKIENVSAMLGHTNITQTQRYAKVLAQSVHDDFEMMREKLSEK